MVYVIFKNKLQRLINIPIFFGTCLKCNNRIGNVIVKVLSSNVIERGFESLSGQTKEYEIDICCFSAKHAALRNKSKDLSARKSE